MKKTGEREGARKQRHVVMGSRRSVAPSDKKDAVVVGSACDDVPRRTATRIRASVLFVELRGLMALAARREPDLLVRLLDEFFTAMTDVAVAHRAMIDRVIGDAMMLVYGVPKTRRDDSVRAVRSGLDMQRAFLALRNRWLGDKLTVARELGLGIGVSTGEVIVVNTGEFSSMRCTVIGEPVKRAALLCEAALQADNLVDEVTYGLVHAALDGEAVFTSREAPTKHRMRIPVYRVQRRRAGLRLVASSSEIDPVCHTRLNPGKAVRRLVCGQTYYFCSKVCARRFLEDPEAFGT